MLPLRDSVPHERPPIIGYTLMAINVGVFLFMASLPERSLQGFLASFAVIPATDVPLALRGQWHGILPFFTNMFLHGGWLHLGGNMLFLYIFGDNVEDRMGHGGFFVFYLLCGFLASLAHALANSASQLPSLGASGAIAAVLAAYMVYFPRARILSLVVLGFLITTMEVSAYVYLILWFVLQAFSGLVSLGRDSATGGVAWWAHIGGFLSGLALARLFDRESRERRGT